MSRAMRLDQIADNLYLVNSPNEGRFPFSLSILATGDCNVLFDTGCGGAVLEELKSEWHIDLLVNSHTHPDHFSGNGRFEGFELIVPEMFADVLPDLQKMSRRLAGGGEASEQWLFMVSRFLEHVPKEPTGCYGDGDVIETGALSFEAIQTPGHLADHLCFFEPTRRILLSFDLDLTPFRPWYGHEESDLDEVRESLAKIRKLEPRVVVSSHRDPVVKDIPLQLDRFEQVIEDRGSRILELVSRRPWLSRNSRPSPRSMGWPRRTPSPSIAISRPG